VENFTETSEFRRLYRRPTSFFPSILIGRWAKVGHHGFDIEDREKMVSATSNFSNSWKTDQLLGWVYLCYRSITGKIKIKALLKNEI
jgi:hypothetical protein